MTHLLKREHLAGDHDAGPEPHHSFLLCTIRSAAQPYGLLKAHSDFTVGNRSVRRDSRESTDVSNEPRYNTIHIVLRRHARWCSSRGFLHFSMRRRLTNFLRQLLTWAGLFFLVVTFTPFVSWCGYWLGSPWQQPRGHTLVLLAGGLLHDGRLALDSYWRSTFAARAYHRGHCKEILITGGGSPSVADEMSRMLMGYGVPREAIRLETRSHSTHENALFTVPMLSSTPGPYLLMTSDFHMFRATRTFAKAGLRLSPYPVPHFYKESYRGWERNTTDFLVLVQEIAKIAYYEAHGWM